MLNGSSVVRDLLSHQAWADAEHWRAFGSFPGSRATCHRTYPSRMVPLVVTDRGSQTASTCGSLSPTRGTVGRLSYSSGDIEAIARSLAPVRSANANRARFRRSISVSLGIREMTCLTCSMVQRSIARIRVVWRDGHRRVAVIGILIHDVLLV